MTRLTPSSIQTGSRYGNSVKMHSSCACYVLQYRRCLQVCRPFPPLFLLMHKHPRTYANTMPTVAQMGAVWHEMTHRLNDLFLYLPQ